MTKLTITSVCSKGPVYPMILNFQNGYPSEEFECKCAVLQDSNGKKTIAAEIDQLLYVGVEENENMGQTLLLVRNKKTGKVRLIETEIVELKPIVNDSKLQYTQTSSVEVHQTTSNPLQQETPNLETHMSPSYPQQTETNELDAVIFLNQYEQSETNELETDTIPIHGKSDIEPSAMLNHQLQNASVYDLERISKHLETSEFESNILNHDYQGKSSVIDSRTPKHPEHLETNEIESSRTSPKSDTHVISSIILSKPKYVETTALELSTMVLGDSQQDNTISNQQILLYSNMILSHQQPEREHIESPRHVRVIETNEMELNIIENDFEHLITNKEANNIGSKELKDMLEEKETEMENEGKTTERISFTIDIEIERLGSPEPDDCEESAAMVDRDSNNEIEGESNLESKTQEAHEKQWESNISNKDYSIKPFFVAALGLDSKSERIEQDKVWYTSNESNDIITSVRTKNDSVRSKQTVTENSYICDHCEALFDNKGSMIFHLISHEFVKDKDKDVAKSKIQRTSNDDITNSLSSKQNVTENSYICDNCEAVFDNKGCLIFHLICHRFVKGTDNVAKSMTKSINTDDVINTDLVSSKQTVKDNAYVCDYCESVYENKGCLIFHLVSHKFVKDTDNDITKSITKIINYDVITNNDSVSSEQTSTQNSYICDNCEAVFDNKSSLIFHLNSDECVNDADNYVTKSKIIGYENDHKNRDENENACASYKNFGNTIKKKNHKFKYSEDTKRKNVRRNGLINNERGKHINIVSKEYEIEDGAIKFKNNATTKLIYCKSCDYRTDDMSNVMKHILTHTKSNSSKLEGSYICNDCGREFKTKASLIIHIGTHRDKPKNEASKNSRLQKNLCIICNSTFDTDSDLNNHRIKTHENQTNNKSSSLCDEKNSSVHKLSVRAQTHSKIKPFRCDICKYQCHKKHDLNEHMKSHTGEKPFQCQFCNSKFAKKNGLNRHIKTHTGEKVHECKICESKFSLLSGLKRHLLIHIGDRRFKCATCSAGFDDDSALKRHEKSHAEEKSFKCTRCEYSCITNNDLKRHIKTHSKIKQKSSNSNKNSESHAAEKPFQCTFCIAKFVLKGSLIRHTKIHTGEKGHKCTFCDSTFIQLSDLKRHLLVHTKDKPVKCTACNTGYSSEKALKWHLRRHRNHK